MFRFVKFATLLTRFIHSHFKQCAMPEVIKSVRTKYFAMIWLYLTTTALLFVVNVIIYIIIQHGINLMYNPMRTFKITTHLDIISYCLVCCTSFETRQINFLCIRMFNIYFFGVCCVWWCIEYVLVRGKNFFKGGTIWFLCIHKNCNELLYRQCLLNEVEIVSKN